MSKILDQHLREMGMFGCLVSDMEGIVSDRIGPHFRQHESCTALVFSMLSDVQELIGLGQAEKARQALNRAKWFLNHDIMESKKQKQGGAT